MAYLTVYNERSKDLINAARVMRSSEYRTDFHLVAWRVDLGRKWTWNKSRIIYRIIAERENTITVLEDRRILQEKKNENEIKERLNGSSLEKNEKNCFIKSPQMYINVKYICIK